MLLIQDEAFAVLNASGWSDRKIARALAVHQNTIARWRQRRELPAVETAYSAKFDNAKARDLYCEGASDGEIAKHFGATQSGATRWRQRRGLQPNFGANEGLEKYQKRDGRKMLQQGASRRQVADHLGFSTISSVRNLRRTLPADRLRRTGLTYPSGEGRGSAIYRGRR